MALFLIYYIKSVIHDNFGWTSPTQITEISLSRKIFFPVLFATEVVQSPLFCERKTICVLWFKCLLWFMPKLVACFKTEHLYLNTRTRDEITFTAQPKIQFQPQLFRYGRSIFCLPHWPTFSDIFSLCLNIYSFIPFFLIPNTN